MPPLKSLPSGVANEVAPKYRGEESLIGFGMESVARRVGVAVGGLFGLDGMIN